MHDWSNDRSVVIDRDKFKEYINNKYPDSFHVNDIVRMEFYKTRYYKDQLHKDSDYHEMVDRNGFVELTMIKPTWSGWKIVPDRITDKQYVGTWAYRDSRTSNRFNVDGYQEWLIDVRDKKLESIGI